MNSCRHSPMTTFDFGIKAGVTTTLQLYLGIDFYTFRHNMDHGLLLIHLFQNRSWKKNAL